MFPRFLHKHNGRRQIRAFIAEYFCLCEHSCAYGRRDGKKQYDYDKFQQKQPAL